MRIALKVLPFYLTYFLLVGMALGIAFGGMWTLSSAFFLFFAVPILDLIAGSDEDNLVPEQVAEISRSAVVRTLLRLSPLLYVPIYLALVVLAILKISSGSFAFCETVGLILSFGISGANGITIAHELIQRSYQPDKAFGYAMLAGVSYMHFGLAHRIGHHKNACTPEDYSTGLFGENVYAFYLRTVPSCIKTAWAFEKARLERTGKGVFTVGNRMLWYAGVPLFLWIAVGAVFGLNAFLFFALQGILSSFLLEVVSYIEHYGLMRRKGSNGRYEKLCTLHSWNANQVASNFLLFKLQRHSDHHAEPSKDYYLLDHIKGSPELPFGYSVMIGIALFPPLWRWVMDPKVMRVRQEISMTVPLS